MEVQFQFITDPEALEKACKEISDAADLGFDVETTELDPYKGDLRLVQLSDGRRTKVIDLYAFRKFGGLATQSELAPLRKLLAAERPTKIAHNAKFDAKWTRHHLGVETGGLYDTYLASVLIDAGTGERRHGLADVVQFFLQKTLDKTEQVSDWGAEDLTQAQAEYAARDAAVMPELKAKIDERIAADGLQQVLKLENECVMPVAEMELNGFFLDAERWREQLAVKEAEQAAAGKELQSMLAAGVAQASLFGTTEINLDSQQQVAAALSGLGIPMPASTSRWQLQPLAEQYPQIAKLLEYRAAAKAAGSFGENILEFIEPKTGRIHADFRQIGAPTGRFSCSNPNLQQIPHEDVYRRCFRAEEGNKLVVADYSQIELRILAEMSADAAFIAAFESGADLHAATAARVFGVEPDAVTPDQRSFAKRLNFGVVYGIGAQRFAKMTGLSDREAENALRRYFASYPQMDEWLRVRSKEVISSRAARTMSGRLAKIELDPADRASVGAAQRYARNMPIQGTSADILKRALRLLHERIRETSARLVNIVHDEIVVECAAADAETTRDILVDAMTKAGEEFVKKVPIKVDAAIADEWTK
ncbi:MAG: hypothetical protein IPM50_10195 [Acidobacteriota bacterium]|nr:MAG: hypothetical protein IPM50_10195 [Acidobacteriota bacterium]